LAAHSKEAATVYLVLRLRGKLGPSAQDAQLSTRLPPK
jgi:hypothetical protein